jgi:hypothetical protein
MHEGDAPAGKMRSHATTGRTAVLMAGVVALACAWAQTSRAEVSVSGQPDAIVVDAHDASVEDILMALRDAFQVQYRATRTLDRVISGQYRGPLNRVLSRVLQGFDYVTQSSAGGVTIIILNPSSSTPGVPMTPAAARSPAPPPVAPLESATTTTSPIAQKPSVATRRQDMEMPGERLNFPDGVNFGAGGL